MLTGGVGMVLLGLLLLNPALVLGGLGLVALSTVLSMIFLMLGPDQDRAEALRFDRVVPESMDEGGRVGAVRQVLLYAWRRGTTDASPRWALALGLIFTGSGLLAELRSSGESIPFAFAFGVAVLVAIPVLELAGAAIMYIPRGVDWRPLWTIHVLALEDGRPPWRKPPFWLAVAVLVVAGVGAPLSLVRG